MELCYRDDEDPKNTWRHSIDPHNYVVAFFRYDNYIALKTIPTEGPSATDEELRSAVRTFYIVNTSDNSTFGPYTNEDNFSSQCSAFGIAAADWFYTKNIQ